MIIRGGVNIYPTEVEHVLVQHESISEAAVFGVRDDRLGERVVVALLPVDGATVDVAEVAAFAPERLGAHKRPVEWIVVTGLPRTSTGKVRKHELRQRYEEGSLGRTDRPV